MELYLVQGLMKKRKKVFHRPGSPKAKSLQRFKHGWENYPESMESRRKRGVIGNSKKHERSRQWLQNYFAYEISDHEISPKDFESVCRYLIELKGKGSKLRSVRAYLKRWGFIKWDTVKQVYLNCYRIKLEESSRTHLDRTRVPAKPSPAHRVTQAQQVRQAEPSELERLKEVKERTLKSISWSIDQAEKETELTRAQGWEKALEILKERLSKIDLQISELENCGQELSV